MSETEAWAQKAIDDLKKKNDQEQDEALKKLLKDAMKEAMQEVESEHDKAHEWTKEKIMAVKSASQRQKLIKEHPELFK